MSSYSEAEKEIENVLQNCRALKLVPQKRIGSEEKTCHT